MMITIVIMNKQIVIVIVITPCGGEVLHYVFLDGPREDDWGGVSSASCCFDPPVVEFLHCYSLWR